MSRRVLKYFAIHLSKRAFKSCPKQKSKNNVTNLICKYLEEYLEV